VVDVFSNPSGWLSSELAAPATLSASPSTPTEASECAAPGAPARSSPVEAASTGMQPAAPAVAGASDQPGAVRLQSSVHTRGPGSSVSRTAEQSSTAMDAVRSLIGQLQDGHWVQGVSQRSGSIDAGMSAGGGLSVGGGDFDKGTCIAIDSLSSILLQHPPEGQVRGTRVGGMMVQGFCALLYTVLHQCTLHMCSCESP